jgi:hypothetical protein
MCQTQQTGFLGTCVSFFIFNFAYIYLNKHLIEFNDLCRLWCPVHPPAVTAVLCIWFGVRFLFVFVKSVDVLPS